MALLNKKKQTSDSFEVFPEHLGIIMDGNGRWAKKRLMPRSAPAKLMLRKISANAQGAGQLGPLNGASFCV